MYSIMGEPVKCVMRGHCNAKPTVTFPAVGHHCHPRVPYTPQPLHHQTTLSYIGARCVFIYLFIIKIVHRVQILGLSTVQKSATHK